MTSTSEKVIERELVNRVKMMKGLCIKLIPDFFNGLPDRLVLLPGGIIFFVELKSTNEKPRKLQLLVHNKLVNLGFIVLVLDSVESIIEVLNRYK